MPGAIGVKHISTVYQRCAEFCRRVWKEEVKCKSNYARDNAEIVGMCASLQLITTKCGTNVFGGAWQITGKGLAWLNEKEDDE